ncbi:MAG TPA: diacylglycerol kinase family protein [Acidimicrobiia bacterium]|nr:diacylglycerol kinase family protein [Acidimicrobiia bacterium]
MGASFTVIVNPAAGRGRMARLLPRIEDAIAAADLDAEIRLSRHPGEPPALAHEAVDAGRVVVACGGDGMVGMLAGAVADRAAAGDEAVLGIIPAGSGNDFARTVGLPHDDPLAAVGLLDRSDVTRVDLGRIGDRWFACVASAGFDSEANRWANTVTRLHGTPLYVAAVLRTLATYRPRPVRIVVDGTEHHRRAWLVAVGNGRSYGGGMQVTPAADVRDGRLEVTVVSDVSRFEFLRTFPRVFKGTHVDHPAVDTFTGQEVAVETTESGDMQVFADGEDFGTLPVTVRVVPAALPLLLP